MLAEVERSPAEEVTGKAPTLATGFGAIWTVVGGTGAVGACGRLAGAGFDDEVVVVSLLVVGFDALAVGAAGRLTGLGFKATGVVVVVVVWVGVVAVVVVVVVVVASSSSNNDDDRRSYRM